jgi:DNA gyrase subunit A
MVTKRGVIKRTLLSEYEYQRKGGKIALNLDEGDELVFVMCTDGKCDLMIATRYGSAVRFSEENVRAMGRTARGVRGISLRGDDYVVGVCLVEEDKELFCITENGFGKRSPFDDFRLMKNRGGHGVTCYNITEKSGLLTGIAAVDDGMDMMMITDGGTIIRTPVSGIPTRSRSAGGVIVMRLGEEQKLVNFTTVAHAEPEDEEALEGETEVTAEATAEAPAPTEEA